MTGEEIRALRDQLHLRQRELASLLGCAEVNLWRWESGRCEPGPGHARALAWIAEGLQRDPSLVDALDLYRSEPLRWWGLLLASRLPAESLEALIGRG